MKANKQVNKVTTQLFESKRYFDLLAKEKQDEFDSADDEFLQSEEGEQCEDDLLSLDEIVDDLDNVILKIKETFDDVEVENEKYDSDDNVAGV